MKSTTHEYMLGQDAFGYLCMAKPLNSPASHWKHWGGRFSNVDGAREYAVEAVEMDNKIGENNGYITRK